MQCSINSIILTISLLLKLLSFCGFRALFLLLLQIKFPQWFVSFERQKMCVGYKMCAWACLLVCVCTCMYSMYALYMLTHLLIVISAHVYVHMHLYLCLCISWCGCSDSCVPAYICALVYVCRLAHVVCICVCVVQRKWSDCYLQHAQSFIISSLFKLGLLSFVCLETKYCLFLYLKVDSSP